MSIQHVAVPKGCVVAMALAPLPLPLLEHQQALHCARTLCYG